MTKNLVKRLNEDFSVNAREDIHHQMKVYEAERKEAADRIEQLEAALREIADFELHCDNSNAYRIPPIARAALGGANDAAT